MDFETIEKDFVIGVILFFVVAMNIEGYFRRKERK